jgi:hypothetical protein
LTNCPTAVHNVRVVQDTPVSSVEPAGACSVDQVDPFQRSISELPAGTASSVPTAVHAVAELHDTAVRSLKVCGVPGTAIRCTRQREPFQRSTSATDERPSPTDPTAKQAAADGHDTPANRHPVEAVGSAGFWIDQRTPFQRSA